MSRTNWLLQASEACDLCCPTYTGSVLAQACSFLLPHEIGIFVRALDLELLSHLRKPGSQEHRTSSAVKDQEKESCKAWLSSS